MKALIKIVATLIVLNAVGRVGWAAWNYYQLRDAAEQAVVFGSRDSIEDIQEVILAKAADLDLPIDNEAVTVARHGMRTQAEARYVQPIEVFPRYVYPFTFSFNVEAVSLAGLK